jgi:peptidyl-prolyl cis-trans isomerase A (cyclophilin A)
MVASVAAAQDQPAAAPVPASGGVNPRVNIKTNHGNIVVQLNGEKAPVSTLNFVRYAEADFYDGTIFHRVIKGFMIQGGGYTADYSEKKDGLREPIVNEWTNGLKNARGTIAMARLGGIPNPATSQFFINVVDNARLDTPQPDGAGYAVFGTVVEGMDVVDKIRDTAVAVNPKLRGVGPYVPTEPAVIEDVSVVGEYDAKALEAAAAPIEEKARKEKEAIASKQKDELEAAKTKAEAESGKKAVTTESGLIYIDLVEGAGDSPAKTDNVEVHYTGWLTDGTKFDSSVDRGTPFTFNLGGGVIRGWLEGVATMKVGGKRRLIIPPNMGYGTQGFPPKIGPNAVLVFDVELLGIKK